MHALPRAARALAVSFALVPAACINTAGHQGDSTPDPHTPPSSEAQRAAAAPLAAPKMPRAATLLDGAYAIRWSDGADADSTLTLDSAQGRYRWSGAAPLPNQRSFHFVDAPEGRYAVRMEVDADTASFADLPDGATVAVINFDPDRVTFESTDANALVQIRLDRERQRLFMHSVVSEFQIWEITRAWQP